MRKNRQHFLPDFLLIPYQLIADKRIEPLEEKVYAVIYWYEHLKDGVCTASNEDLARIIHIGEDKGVRSIQNALAKLESLGYIQRVYEDLVSHNRIAIHTTISFRKRRAPTVPKKTKTLSLLPGVEMPENEETPGEFARRFFEGDRNAEREILDAVVARASENGRSVNEDAFKREFVKFRSYWTEPNKSGTKVKWEMESTFDVKRRLGTWFARAGSKKSGRKGLSV